ncbi:hypothetical protein JTB14_025067 [Gonioctena quinquepunctata]|nr:hypothetical protein JTB14_025067 [Gonioctena quinquepunctata]
MGGSQSKFSPEPNDAWHKMELSGKHPRYLQTVMQAIVDLKEPNGSTDKLTEYIQTKINAKNFVPKPKNLTGHVKRALAHAVNHSLVKLHSGKYSLALTKKDFKIFKNFRVDEDPLTDCGRCSAKRKRRPKRSRSRSRSRGRSRRTGRRKVMTGYKRQTSCPVESAPKRSRIVESEDERDVSSSDSPDHNIERQEFDSYIN